MRVLVAAITFITGVTLCFSAEPYRVDVTQEAFAEHAKFIDHLEPVTRAIPE
jgi:hypothetical protein